MNVREGARRIGWVLTLGYWAIVIVLCLIAFWENVQGYDPISYESYVDWSRGGRAFSDTMLGAFIGALIYGVLWAIWRAVAWVAAGLNAKAP